MKGQIQGFPLYTAENKRTFAGAINEFFEEIAEGNWNEDTQRGYLKGYQRLLRFLPRDIALQDYCIEYCNNAVDEITIDREFTSEITVRHYRHLINVVIDAELKHNSGFDDFRKGTSFGLEYGEDGEITERVRQKYSRVRRSLTIEQNVWLMHYLMTNLDTMNGQTWGLLLMFLCGLRNNEACALNFGDIHSYAQDRSAYFLRMFKSTQAKRKSLKASGKTPNANRVVPLMDIVVYCIEKRRKKVETMFNDGKLELSAEQYRFGVDGLPIACLEQNPVRRCNSDDLSREAKRLFTQMPGFDITTLMLLDAELHSKSARSDGVYEKDPTAYLFRHNFASLLYTMEYSMQDIQYLIGHDIERTDMTRNDYMNEDILLELHRKMQKAPLNRLYKDDLQNLTMSRSNVEQLKGERLENVPITGVTQVTAIEPGRNIFMSLKDNTEEPRAYYTTMDYFPSWEITMPEIIYDEYLRWHRSIIGA